jgi:hypothetical protein
MDLKKSQKEIDIAVLAAVRVAHDDIASFAKDDVTEFLQEAWEISWEMNPALQRETYRIGDLRAVLMRQEAFYSALMPRDIFPKYKQYPGDAKLIDLYAKAGRNLQIASKYLKAKILALVTLEAVADMTGGDIPLLLFVGYHPRRHLLPEWESMLDGLSIDRPKTSHEDFIVQLLLESGRTEGSKFDTAKSPVAAFLFTHLNEAAFDRAYAEAMQYLSGSFSSKQLLYGEVRPYMNEVLMRLAQIAFTRSDQILELMNDLRRHRPAA